MGYGWDPGAELNPLRSRNRKKTGTSVAEAELVMNEVSSLV